MKVAVVDLGTNTFHLLIAEVKSGAHKILYKTNVPVKLGEDITKANLIIDTAFQRGIACLKEFRERIDFYEVETVKAVATSGVRSASNGADFVRSALEDARINIEIIDGDVEANYIYEGVKLSGAITQPSLIIDIGGGSTEFIICDPERLIWKKSYNIGAARLMQTFSKSDPINVDDQLAIRDHLDRQLEELFNACKIHKPRMLIGSAGAFETFVTLLNHDLDIKTIRTTKIAYEEFLALALSLILSTHEERSKMRGIIPLRVNMIVMAALLTNYVLEKSNIKQITLSTYDLKMGLLASFSV